MSKRTYTNEDKQKVAVLLATDMPVLNVSKQTGIPRTTIRTWNKDPEFKSMIANIRHEKKDRLSQIADEGLNLAELAQKRLREIIPKDKSVMSLSVLTGTMIDKWLLVNGEPTQNLKLTSISEWFDAN